MRIILLLTLLTSCAAKELPVVYEKETIKEVPIPTACPLPPIPPPYKFVGFPENQELYVTVSDLDGMFAYLMGLTTWIDSADKCIKH